MATVLVDAELEWRSDLVFLGRSGEATLTFDSAGKAGPSPVQALVLSLAACMAMDVVHILGKGRFAVKGCRVRLHGERAPEDPRRLLRAGLHFALQGELPAEKVERAIALSLEKYCSVWHSLRADIELHTTFDVAP
jgi:putative redox protein